MASLDITYFVNGINQLIYNLTDEVKFHGKVDKLFINRKYNKLDLSDVECNTLHYQCKNVNEFEKVILPNSLENLYCCCNNLTSLPNLPNSLIELDCSDNNLTSLPNLPNSLKGLTCFSNELISIPELPNSLDLLSCCSNKLTSLPKLPNSLKELYCCSNPISFLYYDPDFKFSNLNLCGDYLIIEGYGQIKNQEDYDKYMEKIKPIDKKQKLIDEIKNKVPEEDVIRLHSMNEKLGNTSKEITDLITCSNIQYMLIKIYNIDEDLFE